MNSKKILWLSDSPFTNTGYATISRNVLNGVSDEYETHYQAYNYVGQRLPPGVTFTDGFKFKFNVWGCGREGYCKDVTLPRIAALQPDIYVVLLDTFMLYPWMLDMNFAPAKSIFYFPSDGGGGMPLGCEKILQHVTVPVAMARFGQQQVKELYNIDAEYIPHAVDTTNYRPLNDVEKQRVRAELTTMTVGGFPVKGFLLGKFVVGVVARNQGRKMLDRTVKAFADFCKDKPDAVLFLHSDPFDNAAGFDIRELIKRYNIENRCCFTTMKFYESFEYSEMNKVYNAMDVFFLTTSGEGFGIPIIEAMSCEVPIIATDYTTTRELVMDDGVAGIAVPVQTELTGSWNVERALMDIPASVQALNHLYGYPDLRKDLGKTGREKVIRNYSWDVVIPQWKNLFARLSR